MHVLSSFIRHSVKPLLLGVLLPLLANQTIAGPSPYQLAERELTLQEAAGRAEQQYGGKVIKADPVVRNGRNAYRIRLVRPDGRVREIMMDADSGRPLERKRK